MDDELEVASSLRAEIEAELTANRNASCEFVDGRWEIRDLADGGLLFASTDLAKVTNFLQNEGGSPENRQRDWRIEIYDADTGEKISHMQVDPYKGIRAPEWLIPGKVYHTHLLNTGEWAILQQHERGYWHTSPMPEKDL